MIKKIHYLMGPAFMLTFLFGLQMCVKSQAMYQHPHEHRLKLLEDFKWKTEMKIREIEERLDEAETEIQDLQDYIVPRDGRLIDVRIPPVELGAIGSGYDVKVDLWP